MFNTKENKAAAKSRKDIPTAEALGNKAILNLMADRSRTDRTSGANMTGIPTPLKQNFEAHSGFSFNDVRVHYNSERPAHVQALAYTQGNQVYIAPGQEAALPHELGHVIQQKQGRVTSGETIGGQTVNTEPSLEQEADKYAQLLG